MKTLYILVPWLAALFQQTAHAHDMGDDIHSALMLDRLEIRNSEAGNSSSWEGQAWRGGDLDKAWFKTRGEVSRGRVRAAEAELLYSRAITPYWDAQLGVRHDFQANDQPARDWAAFAFKGQAPCKIDVDASIYLGNGIAARFKSGYTLLLTQRLALMPELEANLFGKSDPARLLGSGLSNLDVSLRLRYEISREFAPYLGVTWLNRYGATAGYARRASDPVNEVLYAAGLHLWW